MIFPTIEFAFFFAVVFAGHWILQRRTTAWKWFMLAASYFFYGCWDWRFLALLAASSVVNHACALIMRNRSHAGRRPALIAALVFNLGTLAFFKYYGFFIEQAYAAAYRLGLPCSLPLLSIVLPVGISFFTFQALSYVADVYRQRMPPTGTLLDFALYLSFFPQLVAGPIVRASELVPQLARYAAPRRINLGRAATLILAGLFKKTVIANSLAESLVDPVFAYPSAYGAWDALLAVYGYAVQIYCDFSAYSDMAIGFCLLLGIHLPINFNAPYTADSLQEFWRRWHISLSTFLRDYLYIPLGGSHNGRTRLYRNLMLTFLLGGLWHGAGWTFIVWGALHGVYLCAERALSRQQPQTTADGPILHPWRRVLRRILVFHLVGFSWIFFRSQTFGDAREMLLAFSRLQTSPELATPLIGLALVVGLASQVFDGNRAERLWTAFNRLPAPALALLAALILTLILALGPRGVAPFIYFQF